MPPAADTGTTTFSTPSELEFRATRAFNAPQRLLWAAYTEPVHIKQWLLGPPGWTMPVCKVDLRVGGSWRYVWRQDDGTVMEMTGTYRDVTPTSRLVATERWGPEWPETVNTIEFAEHGGRTTVTTTVRYPNVEARDAAMKTGMKHGMNASFDRLEAFLATTEIG
jgi:uncharacterized protein YndB with AHSA1/START domain